MNKNGRATFVKVLKNTNPFDRHGWEHTDLLYEYRGRQYIVTKHNNGYAFDPLWKQHQEEQKRIDELIAHESDPIPEWDSSAQDAFELFWEYVEGEEN